MYDLDNFIPGCIRCLGSAISSVIRTQSDNGDDPTDAYSVSASVCELGEYIEAGRLRRARDAHSTESHTGTPCGFFAVGTGVPYPVRGHKPEPASYATNAVFAASAIGAAVSISVAASVRCSSFSRARYESSVLSAAPAPAPQLIHSRFSVVITSSPLPSQWRMVVGVPTWLSRGRKSSDSSESDAVVSDGYSSGYDSSDEELSRRVRHDGIHELLPPAAQRLPAALRAHDIQEAVAHNRVVCVLGDTGCGKSTVIPFILGNSGGSVKILCTQPRRMAAISLCEHVQTKFFGQRNHAAVGYRVRGQRTDEEQTSIVYVTAGYLKTMLTHDPAELGSFTHLILDEVHERGIDSDFLSLIVKRLLIQPENESIKLVVMSATLESDLFVDYFTPLNGGARPVTVNLSTAQRGGSLKQIEEFSIENLSSQFPAAEAGVRYFVSQMGALPVHGVLAGDLTEPVQSLAVDLIVSTAKNNFSTLVFLPGLGEIYSVHDKLVDALERRGERVIPVDVLVDPAAAAVAIPTSGHYYHIFVLHSTMPYEEQRLALREPALNARHVVLSTNVAESSLTVPNVDVVIDSGLKKANSYDPTNRVYRLTTVWCSQASCLQRRGRTGRVCNGKYFRLLTEEFFRTKMTAYDTPEVLLMDLSCVFLNAKYISEFWRLPGAGSRLVKPSDILRDLITPPKHKNVKAAVSDLFEAGILRHEPDEMSELSLLGTLATRLHVEPQVARILYFGWLMGLTCEGIVLAAACGIDTDVMRSAAKYQPGNEDKFCRQIADLMWYRTGYDLGAMSEPIAVRNLLWAWLTNHYGIKNSGAPEFFRSAVYAKEFDNLKRSVINLCSQFIAWIQEEISDERAEQEAETLRALLSEKKTSPTASIESVFACGHDFDKLKALLAIAMNNRLLTADTRSGEFDETCSLRFEKLSEQVFLGADFDRFSRIEDIATRLTGRKPEHVVQLEVGNGVNTSWVVCPGRDWLGSAALELQKSDPAEFQKVAKDKHMVINEGSEFFGLVMPVSVRTCMQIFDRRYTTNIEVDGFGKIRLKVPRYANGLDWGRIAHSEIGSQWLPITVNSKSPVGWLHKVPTVLRGESTDRFWGVAGKIVGTTKNMFEDILPAEARAHNVTVLPVAKGGRVAVALLLAALPLQQGLVAEVAIADSGNYEVLRVRMHNRFFELNRCQQYPMTMKMLRAVSAVRRLVSKAIDIPGTCIRRREEDGSGGKLAITAEAMHRVRELQGAISTEDVSLSTSIDALFTAVYSETASSLDLFPAAAPPPTERKIMLIPHTGSSYAEMCLDPTVWTEPDSMQGELTRRVVFRKDQILEIVRRCMQPGFVARIVTDRDKQEVAVVRLAAAGFSVDEIARFLERKPRFSAAGKTIDTILDEQIDEDELTNNADWMMESRIEDVSPDADFEIPESEDDVVSPPPPVPARRPPPPEPQDDFVLVDQRMRIHAQPELVEVTEPWTRPVSQAGLADDRARAESWRSDDCIRAPAMTEQWNSDGKNKFLTEVWAQIEAEAAEPTADKSLSAQERLMNIWTQINRISDSLDI